jgi:hypothetical protein
MTDEVIKIHQDDVLFEHEPDFEPNNTFADFQLSENQMMELYNQNGEGGVKVAWDGDVFTPRSSDTITVYPFYPAKVPPNSIGPFEVIVKGYDSMKVVMQRIEKKLRIPVMYWQLYTRPAGELVEAGYMPQVYKLFDPNGAALDLVLKQPRDIRAYKKERTRIRAELSAQNRQLRLTRSWRTANRDDKDHFTQDQFNRYVAGRDNVEERAEGSIKHKHLKQATDTIRDQALEELQKNWKVQLEGEFITSLRECIYAHEVKLNTSGLGPVRSAKIMARLYSPVHVGNSIDLYFYHHHQTRYTSVESVRYLCMVKNNIFSDQSLKVIKDHAARPARRNNNLLLIEYDAKIHREYRFFTSYHKLDKLKNHLFGEDIGTKCSTLRFARFLVAVAGINYVKKEGEENDDTFGSIFREITRYYPGEADPDEDSEDEDDASDKSNEGYISADDNDTYSSSDEEIESASSRGNSGYCAQQ